MSGAEPTISLACLRALRNSDYEAGKNIHPERVQGTCQWILENDKFINWRDDKGGPKLIWITADPGAGKSVLCRALVDERLAASNPQSATICYFFFRDSSHESNSPTKAISALLHQLFRANMDLIRYALKEFGRRGYEMALSFPVMWEILVNAAADNEAGEIVCILDALDECETVGRDMLIDSLVRYYSSGKSSKSKIKFLITSRPYFSIEHRLQSLLESAPSIRVAGERETVQLQREIDMVIKNKIAEIGVKDNLSPESIDNLGRQLLEMPHQSYLWLILALKELDTTSRESLDTTALPTKTSDLYESILNQSNDQRTTLKILKIITMTERPLSLQEMNFALVLDATMRSYEEIQLDEIEVLSHKIRVFCCSLVEITDSKVYLVHQTAREFLLYNQSAGKQWQGAINPQKSHLDLANACISYLFFDDFKNSPLGIMLSDVRDEMKRDEIQTKIDEYTAGNGFLRYAAEHWVDHFREADIDQKSELQARAAELCAPSSGRFWTWFGVNWFGSRMDAAIPQRLTDLMIASYFGLPSVVQLLLDRQKGSDSTIDFKDSSGQTALHHAAHRGYESVVFLLLQHQASTTAQDDSGSTALHRAAERGQDAITLLLINKGAIIDATDKNGDTALLVATNERNLSVVKVLLDEKADLLLSDRWNRTPEQLALWLGDHATAEELKERYYKILRLVQDAGYVSLGLQDGPLLPVDRKFDARIVYFPKDPNQKILQPFGPVQVNELIDGKVDLKVDKGSLMCKWFHLPANNMRWVQRLMLQDYVISQPRETRNAILKRELWSDRQYQGSPSSKICFMRPMEKDIKISKDDADSLYDVGENSRHLRVIFMPFIHWETKPKHLDIDFFILLQLLLKLLQQNITAEVSESLWQHLPGEDLEFLLHSLRVHWSTSPTGMDGMNSIISTVSSQNSKTVQPPRRNRVFWAQDSPPKDPTQKKLKTLNTSQGNSVVLESQWMVASDVLKQLKPWGLDEEDLEIFRIQPKDDKALVIRSEEQSCKSPAEILARLQECYDLILARDPMKELMHEYVGDKHPLHIRRSLDQSHYYMLDNTRSRDEDQVVSRYGEKNLGKWQHHPIVMMVDQLWLWTIGDTIVTCFPQRTDIKPEDPDRSRQTDVFESILKNSTGVDSTAELTDIIVKECSGACFNTTKNIDEGLRFLDIFESSIGVVANAEAACYKRFINEVDDSKHLDTSNIKEESRLLREIKDIIDELDMMEAIFRTQVETIGPDEELFECIDKIKTMAKRANSTNESLKSLMDLRQKHANLSEARSARLQAEETSRQGNTIMVFTIVTILFLPASFMASFFALAINQFPRNSSSMLDLNYVVKYMMIFTAVVASFFILMAFQINEIAALAKKIFKKKQNDAPNKTPKVTMAEKLADLNLRRAWNNSQGSHEKQHERVSVV